MDGQQARYRRAKAIVMAALELPDQDRERFVVAECAGDEALAEEVRWQWEAVLADLTLPLPAIGVTVAQAPDKTGEQAASSQGSGYRFVRKLGEGGMGVVYLAERSVGNATQQVALKVLRVADGQDPVLLRRFAEERRILAALDHPNIARLLDAGTMEDGQLFLAMEYVQGERIDHYCTRRALSVAQRVALFAKVCAAVQYAHQHLVVHRDIKPANILVDVHGEPRLLDFGIARILADELATGEGERMTVTRGVWGLTPAYASPEQIQGESLTTATDIWSLGAVLYELVSDRLPFVPVGNAVPSALDLANAIVHGTPRPPSRVTRKRIARDLDAIVLKALRRRASERYATAAALAEDLQRMLRSLPVQARRGHAGYRLGLYLRRHRSAAAVALAIVVLLGLSGIERYRQLRQIELERDKAQALAGFMQELFENADPSKARGRRITVAEMLDQGAARLRDNHALPAATRATLMLSIGRAYNQLDIGDKALALLEQARLLQQDGHASALERGRVLAALGRAHSMVVDLAGAARIDAQAIALLEQAPDASREEILRVRINYLYAQIAVEALPLPQIVAQLQQIVDELSNARAQWTELKVQALAALALARASQGEDVAALALADQALQVAQSFYGARDPALIYYRFVQALVMLRHDPMQAVARYRSTIDDYDRLFDHSGPGLAGLLGFFGSALGQMGQHEDAEKALRRSLAISDAFAPLAPDFRMDTQLSLADELIALGLVDQARVLLADVQPRAKARMAGSGSWAASNFLQTLVLQARVERAAGSNAAALALYQQADLAIARDPKIASPDLQGAILAGLSEAQLEQGQAVQGKRDLARLQTLNAQHPAPPYADRVLMVALLQARLLDSAGDRQAASRALAPVQAIAQQRWGACDTRLIEMVRLLETDALPACHS